MPGAIAGWRTLGNRIRSVLNVCVCVRRITPRLHKLILRSVLGLQSLAAGGADETFKLVKVPPCGWLPGNIRITRVCSVINVE
jgi:hypothetical protein